jgi:hypothetical protein
MSTATHARTGSAKTGSISVARARKAADAVKAGRRGRSIAAIARSVPDSFKDRYLGLFGSWSNHAGKPRKGTNRRPTSRKAAGSKTSVNKATR